MATKESEMLTSFDELCGRSATYNEEHSIVSYTKAPKQIVEMFETVGSYMSKFEEKHLKNKGKKEYADLRDVYIKSKLFNLIEESQTIQTQSKCDITILPQAIAGMIEDCDGSFQGKVQNSVIKLVDAFKLQEKQRESKETNAREDDLQVLKYTIIGDNIYALELNYFHIKCTATNNIGYLERWNCTDYEVRAKKAVFYLNSVVYRKNKEGLENNIPSLDFD